MAPFLNETTASIHAREEMRYHVLSTLPLIEATQERTHKPSLPSDECLDVEWPAAFQLHPVKAQQAIARDNGNRGSSLHDGPRPARRQSPI
jgi:hypothetical protein